MIASSQTSGMFADARRLRALRQQLQGGACAFADTAQEPLDFWIPFNDFNVPETTGGAQCSPKGVQHA